MACGEEWENLMAAAEALKKALENQQVKADNLDGKAEEFRNEIIAAGLESLLGVAKASAIVLALGVGCSVATAKVLKSFYEAALELVDAENKTASAQEAYFKASRKYQDCVERSYSVPGGFRPK